MRVLVLLLALQIPLGLDRGLLAPPDNPVTPEKAALGRRLFDDRRLSVDQSRACSDCLLRRQTGGRGGPRPEGDSQRARHSQPDLWTCFLLGWARRHPGGAGAAADPASEGDGLRPADGG